MFFEYHLPREAPDFLDPAMVYPFEMTMERISARMEKMEDALHERLSDSAVPMSAEQFAFTAKKLFDLSPDRFDAMSARELSEAVRLLFDGTPVPARIEFPNAETVVDGSFITVQEWEMTRHLGMGGSESAVAQGISPYTTPLELFHAKKGTPLKGTGNSSQVVFDRGHILEPKVIGAFCKMTGAVLIPENRMFRSRSHPHCIANVDGIVRSGAGDLYVFEAKTTVEGNSQPWMAGRIPRQYVPQCQHYLGVLSDPRLRGTYIGCLFVHDYEIGDTYVGSAYQEGDFVVRLVERDEAAEQATLDAGEGFCRDYLLADIEPPVDLTHRKSGSSGLEDVEFMRKITGPADKNLPTVEIGDEQMRQNAELYLALKAQQSDLKKKTDALDTRLKELQVPFIGALGQATRGTIALEGGEHIEISYTPRSSVSVDRKTLKSFFPEAYAKCVKETAEGSRVFSMSRKK